VYQSSRAKIIYQDAPTEGEDLSTLLDEDDELNLPTANSDDSEDLEDLPELDELPEDPEEDEEDDFVEGSPRFEQFRSEFTKAFGLPLEEARDLVQGLQHESAKRSLNEQKYELSAAWDVPVTEVDKRLAIVKTLWDKLPRDKQQAYDTTKGAQALYAKYVQSQQRKSSTKGAGGTKGSSLAGGKSSSKYWYSESQINAMDAATYAQNSNRIMVAYAQGRVKR
jgi:hypothetical protein